MISKRYAQAVICLREAIISSPRMPFLGAEAWANWLQTKARGRNWPMSALGHLGNTSTHSPPRRPWECWTGYHSVGHRIAHPACSMMGRPHKHRAAIPRVFFPTSLIGARFSLSVSSFFQTLYCPFFFAVRRSCYDLCALYSCNV